MPIYNEVATSKMFKFYTKLNEEQDKKWSIHVPDTPVGGSSR